MTPGARAPRRVVMVAHSHHLGGMERHVITLADALAAQDHAVAFAGPLDGWLGEHMRAAGHHCLHAPMRGMYDPGSAWRIARFARRWRADLLHGHSQRGGRYAAWAGRWAGLPSVATAHSTGAWRWFAPGQRVIAVSQAVAGFLVEQGLPREQVQVVYSGMPDFGQQPAPPLQAPSARQPLVLGMIARVDPVKGHDLAIEAVARLHTHLPLPLQLVLAGPDHLPWAAQLRERVQRLGIADMVSFLGPRSDVPQLLAGFDVLLAPSRREGLSLTLIEAAIAGRPVIASRVGGNAEIVEHEHTGLLCPPDDVPSLAAAIERMAADAGWRQQLGAAARQAYEARFTVQAMQAGTVAVYDAASS